MTDRPILMSRSMVRATLREIAERGTGKCETRRCVTKSTTTMDGGPWCNYVAPEAFNLDGAYIDESYPDSPILKMPWDNLGHEVVARLRPRIEVGDRLWVREAWRPMGGGYGVWDLTLKYPADNAEIIIDDDVDVGDWIMPKAAAKGNVPSIHMPRWASRITLEVTDVKFERIQEITEEGARREGVAECPTFSMPECPEYSIDGVTNIYPWLTAPFEELWDSLNKGRGYGWASNPWVVVIKFKPVLQNVGGVTS